ncbi:MAG: CCA tRNA nucleotidyltransferase, partial [Alphaproteobacteria bacterium]|nr:CCA tRNA nucleotidyltransferase [Alphaproteobacteria bacterium]
HGLPVDDRGLRWGCVQVAGCDITTFRTERYSPGSRYPTVTLTTDLAADAVRRDFTCNAVYLAPEGALTDPFGGAADWCNGQVVWLGHPAARLAEDPLRWWRWLRFCAEAGPTAAANPVWYDVTTRQRSPLSLHELIDLAAGTCRQLSVSRRHTEQAKFGAQPHAAAVREIIQPLLASADEVAQKLFP